MARPCADDDRVVKLSLIRYHDMKTVLQQNTQSTPMSMKARQPHACVFL